MANTTPHMKLTHAGALKMLDAAIAKAADMGQPQCITIVDDGGHPLAFCRMDGAFSMSQPTSERKARTAAIYKAPTGELADGVDIRLAMGTDGQRINLPGGLPIIVDGMCIGGIGVGSGTGAQDREVANAALAALPGAETF